MSIIKRASAAVAAATVGTLAQAQTAGVLDTSSLTDTITSVGASVGTVVLALAAFAVTIWGGLRLVSLFSGRGR